MALGDGKAKQEAQEIKGELSFILDAVSSIGDKLISSFQDAVDEANQLSTASDAISKTLKRGLVSDMRETVKNTENLIRAQSKAEKGLLKQSELQKLQNQLAENRILFEARKNIALKNGIELTQEEITLLAGLKEKNEHKMFEFGQLEMETILAHQHLESLSERKTNLHREFKAMQENDQATAKTLNEKYGDGSIDLEKGEFIPA